MSARTGKHIFGEVYLRFGVLLFAFVGTHNGESLENMSFFCFVLSFLLFLLFCVLLLFARTRQIRMDLMSSPQRNSSQLLRQVQAVVSLAIHGTAVTIAPPTTTTAPPPAILCYQLSATCHAVSP